MAKETVTKLIDDLDGTPADSTIRIGLEGVGAGQGRTRAV
jgi:hypothetical protein